ncbi:MAG: tRNA (guanosine(46)-N7)-methyltransferase TrmB [Chitinophagaceae bacterium]|nr:tRNA (guanosine(46)-N7)-methyltransferase TrmB [Chitinophagaceae bacterium]
MGQKKLQRFAELNTFPNVLQFPQNMAGQWHVFFQNRNPIVLELACGKGEYAVGLGRMYPEKNFIGVDIKGNRMWVGARKALEEHLKNIAFLRTQIEMIHLYFAPNEVSEIWLTFPDPHLKLSKAKKRLTHPRFLRLYKQILQPGGYIHLKTDSPALYSFTKKVIDFYGCLLIEDKENIYDEPDVPPWLAIKTFYEQLDISGSRKVHYLCFQLSETIDDKERDAEFKMMLKILKEHEAAD